ncbi:MAG: hypothetical protein ACI4VJ_01195 [Methanosphaera sp.]
MKNMAKYQLQLHQVLDDGTDVSLYPINTALDVQVGKLSTGSLTLPGNASDEILSQTLANIKKYLTNLGTVAAQKRGVSNSTTSTSEIDLATSKAVNDLKVRIDGNDETLATHTTQIAGKAPIMHAVNTLTYGGATGTLYGHVKLSDTYTTAVANGDAANSIGASQNALYNAYNSLNTAKAPNNHAVNNSTYGLGTASLYGHVKLSDTYSSKVSSGAAANSLAASQNALYNAYAALKSVNDSQTTSINGKAPTQHTSTTASTYGAGTGSVYGHVMLSDAYDTDNSATGAAANSLGASSWAVYRAYSSLATICSTKLAATHADEKATASKFSHVKLSDSYTTSGGAASAGVGASSAALVNAYTTLNTSLVSAQSSIETLNSRYDELKKSVADGKALLATSISQYVTTASDATWNVLNTNMESAFAARYSDGVNATKVGTAVAANVLSGKTFTNSSGVGLSGTMTNRGAWTSSPTASGKTTIPAGYHNGSGYVDTSGVYNAGVSATKVGTAAAAQVLSGYTFTNSSGVGISGTMANKGAWTSTSSGSGNVTIPAGYHNGSGYVNCSGAYNAGVSATKVGTAAAAQVLSGYTFTNSSGVGISGTMANKGAWTSTSSGSGKITIPAGYHDGSGYVDCSGAYNAGVSAGGSGKYKYWYTAFRTETVGTDNYNTKRTFDTGFSSIEKAICYSIATDNYPSRVPEIEISGGTVTCTIWIPQDHYCDVEVLVVGN